MGILTLDGTRAELERIAVELPAAPARSRGG
jgi:hypothetical protein